MTYFSKRPFYKTSLSAAALCLTTVPVLADQVFNDDLIVSGSACIGIDCVNGESFGFDTIRLKENNLRIKAQDTSNSASFPSTDWQITFNDSSNGGANKFSIDDIDTGRTPFTIEGGAPSNALYVDSSGNVGAGTSNPIVQIHAVDGNSPTLRLEQDGSAGFTAQTWDLAGNEAGFFLRDATNGSKLSFRVQPNTPAETLFMRTGSMTINESGVDYDFRVESDTNINALFLDGATGNIGLETASPQAPLHIVRASGGFAPMLELENTGPVALIMDNNDATNPVEWRMGQIPGNTDLVLVSPDGPGDEFKLGVNGDLTILGSFFSGVTELDVPDYVFADDYELRPLAEVRTFIDANSHLPDVPSAREVAETGLNMTEMQMTLLRKVEELTLYTLAQEEKISMLTSEIERLAN